MQPAAVLGGGDAGLRDGDRLDERRPRLGVRHQVVAPRRVQRVLERVHDAVAGIDFGNLADVDVFGLRFRDPDFRFQLGWIGDAGEVRARTDLLPHFHRNLLEHTAHVRLHPQVLQLADAQLVDGASLIDGGFLRCHLGLHTGRGVLQLLLCDGQTILELRLARARLLDLNFGDQAVFEELLLGLELQGRILVVRLDARDI